MIEIIPAIDIIDGKCVRLSQGDYSRKTVYYDDPLTVAREFEKHGIKRLHLVDLDGAKAGKIINHEVLRRIASGTNLIIDFGGGLKSNEDLKIAFDSGATMITGGSIAVKSPDTFLGWLEEYGSEKIILGADVKDEMISVSGWTEDTDIDLLPFIDKYHKAGISKVICTDISKDGMLTGASLSLYTKIRDSFPDLFIIASGGVSNMEDILELDDEKIGGVITGKAIYEKRISLDQISDYISGNYCG